MELKTGKTRRSQKPPRKGVHTKITIHDLTEEERLLLEALRDPGKLVQMREIRHSRCCGKSQPKQGEDMGKNDF